mmetsp:Transcript_18371/g.27243  ORF Transcript_18371/g.27243 Transcript_18371/m.27243 type:complete len:103 (-) Transcript_18371:270-578(-)
MPLHSFAPLMETHEIGGVGEGGGRVGEGGGRFPSLEENGTQLPLNQSQSAMPLHSFAPLMETHEIGGVGEGGGGVGGFPSLEEQIVPFHMHPDTFLQLPFPV